MCGKARVATVQGLVVVMGREGMTKEQSGRDKRKKKKQRRRRKRKEERHNEVPKVM